MNGSTIGIKIADGSFYPVLEEGFIGRKKLTLTTVKENQSKVQIDLYQGPGGLLADTQYIGSLVIENILPAARGEPGIDLLLGVNEEGDLEAEASDRSTGEKQALSLSLKTLSAEENYEIPEFEMDREDFEPGDQEADLGDEASPATLADRREGSERRAAAKPRSLLGAVAIVILGLALIAAIGVILYMSLSKPEIPPLIAGKAATEAPAMKPDKVPAPAASAPVMKPPPPEPAAAPQASAGQSQTAQPSTPTALKPEVPAAAARLRYTIKKGDTLWDIASTYYRDPWMYGKLAKANSISNPDLILAGTRILIPED